jgi:hypothetical protein
MNAAPKQSIKIRLGSRTRESSSGTPGPATPVSNDVATPGVKVHNEALERQQQMVAGAINGNRQSAANGAPASSLFGAVARAGSSATPVEAVPVSRGASATSPSRHTNGYKNEGSVAPPAVKTHTPMHPGQVTSQAATLSNQTIYRTHYYSPPAELQIKSETRPPGQRKCLALLHLLRSKSLTSS